MIAFGGVFLMAMGCQDEKIANLEKQNQDLKAEVERNTAAADYDLQAKCSKDAKTWFDQNWDRDKDTQLLDFTNHYNKSMNKCFIEVEYHFTFGSGESWVNNVTLWDIYENTKYANLNEHHTVYVKPTFSTETTVVACELADKKCTTANEFYDLVRPYMSN